MSHRFYYGAIVGLMLISMGVVMGIVSPGLSDTDLGVVDSQVHLPVVVATLVFYATILSRIVTNPAKLALSVSKAKLLIPIVLFSMASAVWSTDPLTSIRRSAFLLLTVIVGVILGTDFDVSQIGRLVAIASAIHMAACCVLFVTARNLLYSPSDLTALKGLTTHKNVFGLEMAVAVITFILVPFSRLPSSRWLLALCAGIFLVMSHSTGSLIATLCAVVLLPLLSIARFPVIQRVPLIIFAIVIVAGVGVLSAKNAALLPALFSKDSTLTGRTELWSLVLVAIGNHPWFGYGFDSFWQGLQGDSLSIIRAVGWLVPTAHNGYLDLVLGVGIVGATLFAIPVVQMVVRSLRYLGAEYAPSRYYPIGFIAVWLVYNFNESALLSRSGMPLLFLVAISTSLGLRECAGLAHGYAPAAAIYPMPRQLDLTYWSFQTQEKTEDLESYVQ